MSDPRAGMDRDSHIGEASSESAGAQSGDDTRSETSESEPSLREAMQQELMDLGVWLTRHPEAARKNLKPVRGSVVLEPGVYYNTGTGMIERLHSPQHIALGARWFRVDKDPAAPLERVRRKVLEGK